MLVCNVSLRPPRRAIAATLTETAAALDASTTGFVVFATLVDDPANVLDVVDAFLGEVMLEAASAADSFDAGIASTYTADIEESVTAASSQDATATSATMWNPSDKSVNVTLSNGNLSAQGTSATGTYGARATSSKSSGKYYFEITWTVSLQNVGPGIALATANLVNLTGFTGAALVNFNNGTVFINSSSSAGNISTYALGDVCCIAVDLTNQKIWFRKNGGNWDNNATHDPTTNAGGFSISFISTNPIYPLAVFAASTTSVMTANFGATAFAQSVPSGFSAWG